MATGYVVAAIILTSLHTAPLSREFMGFKPERSNLFDALAPDRQWLGFTQYVSEHVMRSGSNGPIFDGAYSLASRKTRVRFRSGRRSRFDMPSAARSTLTAEQEPRHALRSERCSGTRTDSGSPRSGRSSCQRPLILRQTTTSSWIHLHMSQLAHMVYFTLEDASPAKIDEMVAACQKYLKNHPGVVFFAAGTVANELARPVNDRMFHVALHVVFKTKRRTTFIRPLPTT